MYKDIVQQFFDARKIDATIVEESCNAPFYELKIVLGPKGQISKIEKNIRELGLILRLDDNTSPFMYSSDGFIFLEFMRGEHPMQTFESILDSYHLPDLLKKFTLPLICGTTKITKNFLIDLAKLPHMLVSGLTGSGKSVFLHSVIQSIAWQAKENNVSLILMDPKRVEFVSYENLDCLPIPVAFSQEEAEKTMKAMCAWMENRLQILKNAGCVNLTEYRKKCPEKNAAYVVVIIDELQSLIQSKGFQADLASLAAKGRAAGFSIIVATQYPHSRVVNSTITTHFDGRVAFRLQSGTQSRVVLNQDGAENLQGKGDGLFSMGGEKLLRFHGAFANPSSVSMKKYQKKFEPVQEEETGFWARVKGLMR